MSSFNNTNNNLTPYIPYNNDQFYYQQSQLNNQHSHNNNNNNNGNQQPQPYNQYNVQYNQTNPNASHISQTSKSKIHPATASSSDLNSHYKKAMNEDHTYNYIKSLETPMLARGEKPTNTAERRFAKQLEKQKQELTQKIIDINNQLENSPYVQSLKVNNYESEMSEMNDATDSIFMQFSAHMAIAAKEKAEAVYEKKRYEYNENDDYNTQREKKEEVEKGINDLEIIKAGQKRDLKKVRSEKHSFQAITITECRLTQTRDELKTLRVNLEKISNHLNNIERKELPNLMDTIKSPLKSPLFKSMLNNQKFLASRDASGRNILHYAVIFDKFDHCIAILKVAPHLANETNVDKNSPLHNAYANNNTEIINLLIERGADPTLKNVFGMTPEQSKPSAMNNGSNNVSISHANSVKTNQNSQEDSTKSNKKQNDDTMSKNPKMNQNHAFL